jgi:hypothetical protein
MMTISFLCRYIIAMQCIIVLKIQTSETYARTYAGSSSVTLFTSYYDITSELAQLEYRDLVDFARLELNKDDY